MVSRKIVIGGIILSIVMLTIATLYYPGGSNIDAAAQGYNWAHNYISNLLSPLAVNGMNNTARPWAIAGILSLSLSFAIFFWRFSEKINIKSGRFVIRYGGITASLLALITVMPSLHDVMVTLSSVLTLIVFFYITIFVIKSKSQWMKLCSVIFLLTFYLGAYMYFTRSYLEFMPIMQKLIFMIKIVWVLALEYFPIRDQ